MKQNSVKKSEINEFEQHAELVKRIGKIILSETGSTGEALTVATLVFAAFQSEYGNDEEIGGDQSQDFGE